MTIPFALLLFAMFLALGALHSDKRIVSLVAGVFALCVPAILFFAYVDRDSEPFERFTLRMQRLEVNAQDTAQPLFIGGDPLCDDLIVSGLDPHSFAVTQGRVMRASSVSQQSMAQCAQDAVEAAEENEEEPKPVALAGTVKNEFWAKKQKLSGTMPLVPGDSFCLADCGATDARWFVVKEDGRSLQIQGDETTILPELPRRGLVFFIPREVLPNPFREYRASQAVFPLRDYGLERAEGYSAFDDPCVSRHLCDPATNEPVNSFLFFDDDDQLSLALLDNDASLKVRAAASTDLQDRSLDLPDVGSLDIWEVRYANRLTDFEVEPRASYIRKRLSLIASLAEGKRRLSFGNRAPSRPISKRQIETAADLLGGADDVTVFVAGAPQGRADTSLENVIRFERIGGQMARSLLSAGVRPVSLSFSPDLWREEASSLLLPAPRMLPAIEGAEGVSTPHLNQTQFKQEQARSAPARLVFTLDRLTFPQIISATILAWTGALLVLFASRLNGHRRIVGLLAVVQLLLVWRVLVAFGSFGLDSAISPLSRTVDVVMALAIVPALILAVAPSPRWRWPELAMVIAIVGVVGGTIYWIDLLDRKTFLLWLGTLGALFMRIVLESGAADLTAKLGEWATWIVHTLREVFRSRTSEEAAQNSDDAPVSGFWSKFWAPFRPFFQNRALALFFAIAFILFLLRFGGLLLGAREQIGVMRISVIYLPLSILVWAGVIQAIRNARSVVEVVFATGAIGLTFAGAAIVADSGFTLIFAIPAFVALLAVVIRGFWRVQPAGIVIGIALGLAIAAALIVPSLALSGFVIAVIAAIAGFAWLRMRTGSLGAGGGKNGLAATFFMAVSVLVMMPAALLVPGSVAKALIVEAHYNAASQTDPDRTVSQEGIEERVAQFADRGVNGWRIDAIFDPSAINDAGLDDAERLRRWRFTLERLTASQYGNGFPYSANIADVRVNQADDNLSAVHIMAPFGRAAGAALILLLAGLALVTVRSARHVSGFRQLLGGFAIWSFAIAGSYMIAANLALVPFTGRNVYFLAAFSFSDLIEATALIVMTLLALDRWPAEGKLLQ